MKYFCDRCKYLTNDRTKFTRHILQRKKICSNITNCDLTNFEIADKYNINNIDCYETNPEQISSEQISSEQNICKYCSNCYKNKYTLKRHQTNNCSEIKQWYTYVKCIELVEYAKMYSKLRKSLSVEHYNIDVNNMSQQIVLHGIKTKYKCKMISDDNISVDKSLTDTIIEHCEKNLFEGIPEIINKIYLNTDIPQQMIFYHPSIEDDHIIVYHWNYWIRIPLYNFFITILRNILIALVNIMATDDVCDKNINDLYDFIDNGTFNDDIVQMLNIIKTNIHNASQFIEQNIICNICKKSRS
jgi:hypothetical protein